MSKARMLKPDLRTSERVAAWPREVRYFWVLLWGYADDHGKGKDNPLLVKADCFPLDADITGETIDEWLELFARDGVIIRYEVVGVRYFKIVNWREHQKPPHPTADVLPEPEAPGATIRSAHARFMHGAGAVREGLTPKLGWVGYGLSGGDAEASQEPPLFCSAHPNGNATACGHCGDSRRLHDKWVRETLRAPATVHQIVPKPVKHIEGLCDAHRQPEADCEMCEYERTHPQSVGSLA